MKFSNLSFSRSFISAVIAVIAFGFFDGVSGSAQQSAQVSSALKGSIGRHVSHGDSSGATARGSQLESQTAQSAQLIQPGRLTASWTSTNGAKGYRIEVASDSSFIQHVPGYEDLDVGDSTETTVAGLTPNKTYYYRVRAYSERGTSAPSVVAQTTATIPTAGLVITPTFDNSITSDSNSAAIETTINQAIAVFQSLFRDNIQGNVSILFRYTTTDPDGNPLPSDDLAESDYGEYLLTWSQYITALSTDATTNYDATANASLPSAATPLSTYVVVSSANGRALQFNTPAFVFTNPVAGISGSYDGIVTINSGAFFQFTRPPGIANFDALTAIEHEMDEILGLGSAVDSSTNNPPYLRPQDLFAWFTAGGRNFTESGTRYFSIDGGVTPIINFNQDPTGDLGDWLSPACPQLHPYVQNAFGCAGTGQYADIGASSPEGINLDVIGYDLVIPFVVTTPSSSTFTIHSGTQEIILEAWGAGGGGGVTRNSTSSGGGGGAYVKSSFKVNSADWGKKISYTVGAGGKGGQSKTKPGSDGVVTSISGTLKSSGKFTLHAGAGKAGGNGGYAGAATGGQININGSFAPGISGGNGANGGGLQGIGGSPKIGGSAPGGGGGGPINGIGGPGANGEVRITFF